MVVLAPGTGLRVCIVCWVLFDSLWLCCYKRSVRRGEKGGSCHFMVWYSTQIVRWQVDSVSTKKKKVVSGVPSPYATKIRHPGSSSRWHCHLECICNDRWPPAPVSSDKPSFWLLLIGTVSKNGQSLSWYLLKMPELVAQMCGVCKGTYTYTSP